MCMTLQTSWKHLLSASKILPHHFSISQLRKELAFFGIDLSIQTVSGPRAGDEYHAPQSENPLHAQKQRCVQPANKS